MAQTGDSETRAVLRPTPLPPGCADAEPLATPPKPAPKRMVKAADLAREMGEWLAETGIEPGERLGDRAGLAGEWVVSESTMREAVRLLEAAGVVEQRVGVGGGVFFNPREAGVVAQALTWSARLRRAEYAELLEALADVEALIAARAARSASPEQIRRCEEAARATSTLSDPGSADTHFHDVLADCAGNRVLALLRRALEEAVAAQAAQMRAAGSREARDPDHVTYSHAHIVDAVREKDAAEAARRVRRHLRVPLQSQDGQEVAG